MSPTYFPFLETGEVGNSTQVNCNCQYEGTYGLVIKVVGTNEFTGVVNNYVVKPLNSPLPRHLENGFSDF